MTETRTALCASVY